MTLYAPTDFVSITIPEDRGGCGHPHEAGDKNELGHAVIDCEKCEPHIAATRHGFAATPSGVHLTTDEIGEAESAELQATRAKNRTWGDPRALGDALAQALTKATPPQARSLAEQVAGMSEEERAALRELLGDSGTKTTKTRSTKSTQSTE